MTNTITASETANNVSNLTPVIRLVTRADRTIDVSLTSQNVVEANFRHIVNRRLRWSDVAAFVEATLDRLFESLPGSLTLLKGRNTANVIIFNTRLFEANDLVVDAVRVALNRRRSWTTAGPMIREVVRNFMQVGAEQIARAAR